MKIMVPLSNLDMLDALCQAGADEFYFGFWDAGWNAVFGTFEEINRMSSFGEKVNFAFQDIGRIIEEIHVKGKKAFVTINSAAYSLRELGFLEAYALDLEHWGADGLIVGSIALLQRLRDRCRLPLTVSTMGGIYNSDIAAFYRDLGVERIILPRDITLVDMRSIVKRFPELAFEAFLMRNGCKYSDANCMAFHARKYVSMCAALDQAGRIETEANSGEKAREIYENHALFAKAFHKNACGLCAIDELLRIGVSSVKIVGRADDPRSVCDDVRKVRALIDRPGHSQESYGESCLYHMNCYYSL